MNLTVPDSLAELAREVRAKRREISACYDRLCDLNDELRALGGVAFSAPNADGMCISYRVNLRRNPSARGYCAEGDRDRTSMNPDKTIKPWASVPADFAIRVEAAHRAWQAAAGAAENARLRFEASGQAFLEEILEKEGG